MTYISRCHFCEWSSGGCTGACNSHRLGRVELPPKGCICPPTSEKTCQRWDCGRKDCLPSVSARSALGEQPEVKG